MLIRIRANEHMSIRAYEFRGISLHSYMTFRYLLFAIIFLGCSKFLSAQDLIVTTKNDSIKCRILKDDFNFIYYTLPTGDSSKIKAAEVSKVRKNYILKSSISPLILTPDKLPNLNNGSYRMYVSAGYSHLSAKTLGNGNADIDKQIKALKSGYHYSIGGYYYGKKNLGIGLRYLGFKSSNKQENIAFTDTNNTIIYGELSDKISTNFYAISFGGKAPFFNEKMDLLLGLSVGYLQYKNNSVYLNPMEITGNTIGYLYEIGFDYKFNEHFAAGIEFNVFQATMKEYTYDTGVSTFTKKLEEKDYENIARIEVSAGFRYYINR